MLKIVFGLVRAIIFSLEHLPCWLARMKRNKSEKLLAVYNSLSISFFSGVNTNVAFYWQPCSTLLDTLLLITLTKMATATRNYKKQKFWSH